MTIDEQILEAMSRWVSERLGKPVEVISYKEDYSVSTCGYDTCLDYSFDVDIRFMDKATGETGFHTYTGELSRLIRELY